MITKSLIAAAVVAAAAATAAPANAKVDVDVYLGLGDGYGPGYYAPTYPVYGVHARPRAHHGYGISCENGRDEVRDSGFRKVRAVDCSGRHFTYKARRHGDTFIVKVSRRNGDIISVRETW
jgi:hypothetical protein